MDRQRPSREPPGNPAPGCRSRGKVVPSYAPTERGPRESRSQSKRTVNRPPAPCARAITEPKRHAPPPRLHRTRLVSREKRKPPGHYAHASAVATPNALTTRAVNAHRGANRHAAPITNRPPRASLPFFPDFALVSSLRLLQSFHRAPPPATLRPKLFDLRHRLQWRPSSVRPKAQGRT